MAKTTTDLISNVKRRAQLPDDNGTLSNTDILAFATDEIQNVIAPRLMAVHEWHFAFYYNVTLSSTRSYRINKRVAGNKIISVEYYDGTSYRFISLKHPLTQRQADRENYSIYGNNIVLSDACPTSGTLKIRAFLRPSELVAVGTAGYSHCSSVSGTLPSNLTLTVVSSSGFSTGDELDVIWETTPYDPVCVGASVTSVADATHVTLDGTTVIADAGFPTASSVNGFSIAIAGKSDKVMLPDELHDYLAQKVAIRCMEARGFTKDMDNHLRKLTELESAFDRLMSPRSSGEYKAIVDDEWAWDGRRI